MLSKMSLAASIDWPAFASGPARPVPQRRWRSHGNHPLPTDAEALDEPLAAFPSWLTGLG